MDQSSAITTQRLEDKILRCQLLLFYLPLPTCLSAMTSKLLQHDSVSDLTGNEILKIKITTAFQLYLYITHGGF